MDPDSKLFGFIVATVSFCWRFSITIENEGQKNQKCVEYRLFLSVENLNADGTQSRSGP